jgi:hypothetical protein
MKDVADIRKQLRDGSMQFASDEDMAAFCKKCGL